MNFLSYELPGIDSSAGKIAYIMVFAVAAHLAVLTIRRLSTKIVYQQTGRVSPKTRSIASLANIFIVFSIYFWVVGFILQSLDCMVDTGKILEVCHPQNLTVNTISEV
jgi:hypothetical protein